MVRGVDQEGMDAPGTQLGANLGELLQHNVVNHVRVFNFSDTHPRCESSDWSFDTRVLRVGKEVYKMRQLLRVKITNQTLTLHIW